MNFLSRKDRTRIKDKTPPLRERGEEATTPEPSPQRTEKEQVIASFIEFLNRTYSIVEALRHPETKVSPLELINLYDDPQFFPQSWRSAYTESFRALVLQAAFLGEDKASLVDQLGIFLAESTVVTPLQALDRLVQKLGSRVEDIQQRSKNWWLLEVGRPRVEIDPSGNEYWVQDETVNEGLNSEYSVFPLIYRIKNRVDPRRVMYHKLIANIRERRKVDPNGVECKHFLKKETYTILIRFGEYSKKIEINQALLANYEGFQQRINDEISLSEFLLKIMKKFDNERTAQNMTTDENNLKYLDYAMKVHGFLRYQPTQTQINTAYAGQERIQDEQVQRAIGDLSDHTAADFAVSFCDFSEVSVSNLKNDPRFLNNGVRIPEQMIFGLQNGLVTSIGHLATHPFSDGASLAAETRRVLEKSYNEESRPDEIPVAIPQPISMTRLGKIEENRIDRIHILKQTINLGTTSRGNTIRIRERLFGTDEQQGLYAQYTNAEKMGKYATKAVKLPVILHFASMVVTGQEHAQFLDANKGRLSTVESVLPPDVQQYISEYSPASSVEEFDVQKFEKFLTCLLFLDRGRKRNKDFIGNIIGTALMAGKRRKTIQQLGRLTSPKVTEMTSNSLLTSILVESDPKKLVSKDESDYYVAEFATALNDANPQGIGFSDNAGGGINVVYAEKNNFPGNNKLNGMDSTTFGRKLEDAMDNMLLILEDGMKYYNFSKHAQAA